MNVFHKDERIEFYYLNPSLLLDKQAIFLIMSIIIKTRRN